MDWERFPHYWSLVGSTDGFHSTEGAICRSLMSSFLLSYRRKSCRNSWVAFDSKRYDVRGVNVKMYFCYNQLSGTEHRKNCAHVSRFVMFSCVSLYPCFSGILMTSSNGNIFRATCHLWAESICHRWIPITNPVTRCFDILFDLHLNKRFRKQPTPVIWDLRRHRAYYDVIVMWSPKAPGDDQMRVDESHDSVKQLNHTKRNTVRCRYNDCIFFQNFYNRHLIAHPWGRCMGVFINSKSNLCFAFAIAVLYIISWYIGPLCNGL